MRGGHAARLVIASVAVVALLGASAVPPAAAKVTAERVWGNGEEWQVLMPGRASPPPKEKTQPFYVIGALDPGSPQSPGRWGFGPHDNVMHVRPRLGSEATGRCAMLVVVPGPGGVPGVNIDVVPDTRTGAPLVRAADVDGDGVMEPLTSASLVEAAARAGLIALFQPAPGGAVVTFVCPVRHMVHE